MAELEIKCWHCDGGGFVQVHGHFEPEECGYCTQGYIATDEGKALLAFIQRHGAMFSQEIDGDDVEAHLNDPFKHWNPEYEGGQQ